MAENSEQKSPDEELARFHEEHKGDVSLWEAKPARIRVRRGSPSTVFSLRLTPDELTELFRTAEERGLTTSDFIRRAALDVARRKTPPITGKLEKELRSAQAAVTNALATLRDER
jgi:hypothetical protein